MTLLRCQRGERRIHQALPAELNKENFADIFLATIVIMFQKSSRKFIFEMK
jgi:hypothetical protein